MRNFYEPFYAKDGLCSEHPVLMGEVLYHQTVYGHVLVCLDQHPLQEDDLEMVSLLISILEMSLNKREENMDHWNRAMICPPCGAAFTADLSEYCDTDL